MPAYRLVLIFAALVLLVQGEDIETPVAPQREVTSVSSANEDRRRNDKDGMVRDNAKGKSVVHAEVTTSKAKREQALRSILAARRRQLLGPRVSDVSKSPMPKISRPLLNVSKDPPDMLEVQETRYGLYVTAPIGEQVSVLTKSDEEGVLELSSTANSPAVTSVNPETTNESLEKLFETTKNSVLIRINEMGPWGFAESRTNVTVGGSNKSQTVSRLQKAADNENRRKNIVVMPESLYNHFRPVETNIPVEDMSQFLYFGQKLNADVQNSSLRSNNSLVDATSTSPSVSSSRRRNSVKRFGGTSPVPLPRLEDIMNEEMNIALERSTIERNKIPKTKNVFRSPGSGTYFRKSSVKSSEPIIASNVIPTRETPGNASSSSDNRRESVLSGSNSDANPSAHARTDQVAIMSSETSDVRSTAQRAGKVGINENNSTQFDGRATRRVERQHQRADNASTTNASIPSISTSDNAHSRNSSMSEASNESGPGSSIAPDDPNLQAIGGITTWQSVYDSRRESTTVSTDLESVNNEETSPSTINDLADASDSMLSSMIPTTTTRLASSLRIVVTEPLGYAVASTGKPSERADGKEEKSGEQSHGKARSQKNRTNEKSLDHNQSFDSTGAIFSSNDSIVSSRDIETTEDASRGKVEPLPTVSSSTLPETSMRQHRNPPAIAIEPAKTEKNEYKQQHAYAYEITNVTRLLRNYTGPGLKVAMERQVKEDKRRKEGGRGEKDEEKRKNASNNKKEKKLEDELAAVEEERDVLALGEGERGKEEEEVERGSALTRTGAGSVPEIRNVGGSVRSTPQRQPLPLLLLLPTPLRIASSSNGGGKVEPARTTGQLSAGTDVGEATATSNVYDGVGIRGSGSGGGGGGGGDSDSDSGSGGNEPSHIGSTILPTFSTFSTSNSARNSSVSFDEPASSSSSRLIPAANVSDSFTESTIITSTLRWNYTGNDRQQGIADRRESFGSERRYLRKLAGAVLNQRTIEAGLVKEIKRRRGSSSLFAPSLNNNRRIKASRNGATDEYTGSSTSRSMENRTVLPDNENALSWGTEKFDGVGDSVTEMSTELDTTAETAEVPETATTAMPPVTLESPPRKQTEVAITDAGSQPPSISPDAVNFDTSSTLILNSTLRSMDMSADSETTTATTTTTTTGESRPSDGPPVFPVTPKMLGEPGEDKSQVELGSVNETKTEAGRPFGLAKDLDPSEIQKMYRAQTTLRPESIATTISPESERSTDSNPALNLEEASLGAGDNSSTARSPEVRGRNLSDKTRDKDDILPIMQLYNTSNIFNGTGRDSPDSTHTARTLIQSPGVIDNSREVESAKTTTTTTTTTRSTGDVEIGHNPTNARKTHDSTENSGIPRKNNRPGIDSDYENDYATPTRSYINITSQESAYGVPQSNRTRHRSNNHRTALPEYLGYRPELNSSFFEPGMISVSPREPINASEVITKRHDGDSIATQETVAVVSYILATLVVFPIAVGVGLILRRLIIRNRKVLEESDTSSEISCRKDALNLENGDFKTSIEKAITKLPRIQHLCHEVEKPPPPASQESRWEFPRDKLRLQTVLGQGNFGQVWKAEADDLTGHQGTTRLVAVKTVKEGASAREKEDLVRELEIMQQLGNHPNVVTLLGCCTEEEPHYLILEYVMYGKLLAYLRDHRTRQDFYNFSEDSAALTSRDLTVFGYCVSRGMEYLASKKIIHRDLAARNVLVDHNKLCKIADFGMSRFANDEGEVIEARHGRNALPIRWMAPESLIYSLFTTKTDVWSFGILMWEIVTLGSTPYPDMAAREVMRNVQNGYRLERPSHCRSELFRVISRCWHADPDRRPEFQTLRRDMAQLLEDGMNGHYVDLESFASECTD